MVHRKKPKLFFGCNIINFLPLLLFPFIILHQILLTHMKCCSAFFPSGMFSGRGWLVGTLSSRYAGGSTHCCL